jgi:hypothetical protein
MKTTVHTTAAERIGRGLGRAWLGIRRQEARVAQHLVRRGLSPGVATLILWAVKLFVLGVLFYVAFWVAVCAVFLIAAAWIAPHVDYEAIVDPGEWRYGYAGFGLYNREGIRVDPHHSEHED